VMEDVLASLDVPVLGVCLGHQAIAEYYGGSVDLADEVVHGKTSLVRHDGRGLYRGLPREIQAGRYHSLVVTEAPGCMEVTARGAGEIMGLRHETEPVYGVQFHPESVLTPEGDRLIENFVEIAGLT
ncbi:MAG: anthranilate synthase component II, partial [Halobacteriota archaeon]